MHMHAMVILGLLPTTCVIVLYATGPHFCAGIELGSAKNPAMAPPPRLVAPKTTLRHCATCHPTYRVDMQATLTGISSSARSR